MSYTCSDCNREFNGVSALHAHCRDKDDHAYCVDCERLFVHQNALQQHFNDSPLHNNSDDDEESSEEEVEESDDDESYQCSDCDRYFICAAALHAHCRDKVDHAYCEDCERLFVNQDSLQQHFNDSPKHNDSDEESYESDSDSDSDGDITPYCRPCDRYFVHAEALRSHLTESEKHNWCFTCSKDFASYSALQQHNNSRVHAARDFDCPLCGARFKQPSAIAHHVESDTCERAPAVTRHQVTSAVHRLGIPAISISRRIEGPSKSGVLVSYTATERAWNGLVQAYECYLCHRTFKRLDSLNLHLNSAAHDQDEFCCPKKKCGRKFTVISALIQHIESEVCGLARFAQIEEHTRALTDQFSRLLL